MQCDIVLKKKKKYILRVKIVHQAIEIRDELSFLAQFFLMGDTITAKILLQMSDIPKFSSSLGFGIDYPADRQFVCTSLHLEEVLCLSV